ncbi:MAG: choice-of-anchor tandem repeat GloVer-containing protein [Chitinophagaceae bacterium]
MNQRGICLLLVSLLSTGLFAQVNVAISSNAPSKTTPSVTRINSSGNSGILRNFLITDPTYCSGVIEGPDGKLYGTSKNGGINYNGLVFSCEADGSNFTVIYNTSSTQSIGDAIPAFGPDGKLYINISNNLYRIEPNGSGATYLSALPEQGAELAIDNAGWVYGNGFNGTQWILYRINSNGSGYQVLHTFNGGVDGNFTSNNSICITPTGRLFGTCSNGGTGSGTLFSLKPDGSDFIVHVTLGGLGNGVEPIRYGAPTHRNGKIFFATRFGGASDLGRLLSFDTTTQVLTPIFDFGVTGVRPNTNPKNANGKLVGLNLTGLYSINEDGTNYQQLNNNPGGKQNIYGQELLYSTSTNQLYYIVDGGAYKNGFLSKVDATSLATFNIHDFGNVPGGYNPSGVFKAPDGLLYGIAQNGGTVGGGTIFKMNPNGSGFQTIYDFTGADGQAPIGQLLYASDGRLYGMCSKSGVLGASNNRTIFGINTDGSNYSVLHIFTTAVTDGRAIPELAEGSGGNLFGATGPSFDVSDEPSILFRINKNGSGYTVLKSFNVSGIEGKIIRKGLTYYNGFLYGVSGLGGPNNGGTVFRINENGTGFSVIKHFGLFTSTDGQIVLGGLTLASNNKLYGMVGLGGANFRGFVFTINPATLAFQDIYDFNSTEGSSIEDCKFIQASDGKLYKLRNQGLFGIDLNGANRSFVAMAPYSLYFNEIGVSYLTEIPLSVLPVTLTNFSAVKNNYSVSLSWETGQEVNTKKFIVERSVSGNQFDSLLTIEAKGTWAFKINYKANDPNPLEGNNYYRLKIVDKDGKTAYSPVRLIQFVPIHKIQLYPNPASQKLTITHTIISKELVLTITDISGRTVQQSNIKNTPTLVIDIQRLARGIYTLALQGEQAIYNTTFIKN